MSWLPWYIQLLLVGLSLSQLQDKQVFESNKEYIYEYEGHLLSGVPGASATYTGGRITCDIVIQFVQPTVAILKIRNLKTQYVFHDIPNFDPHKHRVPSWAYKNAQKYNEHVRQYLEIPFKIRYHNGQVLEMYTASHDPDWSVDFKKTGLDAMQLASRKIAQGSDRFDVIEPSSEGWCKTRYSIDKSDIGQMNVEKQIELDNCINRDVFSKTSFDTRTCLNCNYEQFQPIRESYRTFVTLKDRRTHYVIEGVSSEHNFTFSSVEGQNHRASFMTGHSSKLVKVQNIWQPIKTPAVWKIQRQPLKTESHKMNLLYKQLATHHTSQKYDSIFSPEYEYEDPDKDMSQTEQLIKAIGSLMEQQKETQVPSLMTNLREKLKYKHVSDLRRVWTNYVEKARYDSLSQEIRSFLMDLMPAIGTVESVDVLVETIKAEKVASSDAATILNTITVQVDRAPQILYRLLSLKHCRYTRIDKTFKRALWLSVGSVAHKCLSASKAEKLKMEKSIALLQQAISREDDRDVKSELFKMLKSYYAYIKKIDSNMTSMKQYIQREVSDLLNSPNEGDKLTGLKCLGNMGSDEDHPTVDSIIKDTSQSDVLRSQAVYSYRRVCKFFPKKIIEKLLPIVHDKKEVTDVRIAAYTVVTDCQPPLDVWRSLGELLQTEEDKYVGTFIYSHLVQYANSSHPCLIDIVKNATEALKRAKPFASNWCSSNVMHFTYSNDQLLSGGSVDIKTIATHHSMIPKAAVIKTNYHALGRSLNFIEIGLNTNGLQDFMDKLYKRPQQSRQSEFRQFRDYEKKISPSQDSLGHLYVKVYGNEMRFFDLDAKYLSNLLGNGYRSSLREITSRLRNGVPVDFKKTLFLGDHMTELSSQAGHPVMFNTHGTLILKAKGSIKVEVHENQNTNLPPRVKIDFNIKPRLLFEHTSSMGTWEVGVSSIKQSRIDNINLINKFDIDLAKAKIFRTMEILKENDEIFKFTATPAIYMKHQPYTPLVYHEMSVLQPFTESEYPVIESNEFGGKLTAHSWQSGQFPWYNPFSVIYNPFYFSKQLSLKVKPTSDPVDKLEFHVAFNSTDDDLVQTQDQVSSPTPSSWFSSWWSEEPKQHSTDKFVDLKQSDFVFEEILTRLKPEIVPQSRKRALMIVAQTSNSRPQAKMQFEALLQSYDHNRGHTLNVKVIKSGDLSASDHWLLNLQTNLNLPREVDTIEQTANSQTTTSSWSYSTRNEINRLFREINQHATELLHQQANIHDSNLSKIHQKCMQLASLLERLYIGTNDFLQFKMKLSNLISTLKNLRYRFELESRQISEFTWKYEIYRRGIHNLDGAILRMNKIHSGPYSILKQSRGKYRSTSETTTSSSTTFTSSPSPSTSAPSTSTSWSAWSDKTATDHKMIPLCSEVEFLSIKLKDKLNTKIPDVSLELNSLKQALKHLSKEVRDKKKHLTESMHHYITNVLKSVSDAIQKCKTEIPRSAPISTSLRQLEGECSTIKSSLKKTAPRMYQRSYRYIEDSVSDSNPRCVEMPVVIKDTLKDLENLQVRTKNVLISQYRTSKKISELMPLLERQNMFFIRLEDQVVQLHQPICNLLTSSHNSLNIKPIISFFKHEIVPECVKIIKDSNVNDRAKDELYKLVIVKMSKQAETILNVAKSYSIDLNRVNMDERTQPVLDATVSFGRKDKLSKLRLVVLNADTDQEQELLERASTEWSHSEDVSQQLLQKLNSPKTLISLLNKTIPGSDAASKYLVHLHYDNVQDDQYMKSRVDAAIRMFATLNRLTSTYADHPHQWVVDDAQSCGVVDAVVSIQRRNKNMELVVKSDANTEKYQSRPNPYLFCVPRSSNKKPNVWNNNDQTTIRPDFNLASCTLKDLQVMTFDRKSFVAPHVKPCGRVLSMDCSRNSRFAVIEEFWQHPKIDVKVYKVILHSEVIKVILHQGSEPVVLRNGQRVHFRYNQAVYYSYPKMDRASLVISKDHSRVQIQAEAGGVAIQIAPGQLSIQTAPHYKSQLCGLCGNNDGNQLNDLMGPNQILYTEVTKFVQQYTLPRHACAKTDDLYRAIDKVNPQYTHDLQTNLFNQVVEHHKKDKASGLPQLQVNNQFWDQYKMDGISTERTSPSRQSFDSQSSFENLYGSMDHSDWWSTMDKSTTDYSTTTQGQSRRANYKHVWYQQHPDWPIHKSSDNKHYRKFSYGSYKGSGDNIVKFVRSSDQSTMMTKTTMSPQSTMTTPSHIIYQSNGIPEPPKKKNCIINSDSVTTFKNEQFTTTNQTDCFRLYLSCGFVKFAVLSRTYQNSTIENTVIVPRCAIRVMSKGDLKPEVQVMKKKGERSCSISGKVKGNKVMIRVLTEIIKVEFEGAKTMIRMPHMRAMNGLCVGEKSVKKTVVQNIPKRLHSIAREIGIESQRMCDIEETRKHWLSTWLF